jgi:hypothetical protein
MTILAKINKLGKMILTGIMWEFSGKETEETPHYDGDIRAEYKRDMIPCL